MNHDSHLCLSRVFKWLFAQLLCPFPLINSYQAKQNVLPCLSCHIQALQPSPYRKKCLQMCGDPTENQWLSSRRISSLSQRDISLLENNKYISLKKKNIDVLRLKSLYGNTKHEKSGKLYNIHLFDQTNRRWQTSIYENLILKMITVIFSYLGKTFYFCFIN